MKLGHNLLKIFIKNNINSLGTSTNQHLQHFTGANALTPKEILTLFTQQCQHYAFNGHLSLSPKKNRHVLESFKCKICPLCLLRNL